MGYGKYAGAYKIATEVRNEGYTCQVVDNFSWLGINRLKQVVDNFVTDDTILIGFSTTLMEKRLGKKVFFEWGLPDPIFFNFIKYIKQKNPNIKICAGGSSITEKSYWVDIDYVVVNKGDNAIVRLLDHLTKGIPLKTTSNNHSKVINGNDYFYTQDQFRCSSIKYEYNDIIQEGESLPIEIARGCIFSCAFCRFDLIGKKIGDWTKSSKIIKEEITRNYEMFGTTHYMFSDELINESVPKLEMIANVTAQLPFKIRYTSYARADMIWKHPEMIHLLLESGALALTFGIETFNHQAGKAIGKGLHPDKIKETLSMCKEVWYNKVITNGKFIIGLPGETEESMWNTVDYLASDECPLDSFGFSILSIDNNRSISKMDSDPKKFGYTIVDESWATQNMTQTQANKIFNEIKKRSDIERKMKFSEVTWAGRFLSLGYTVEDLFNIIRGKNNFDQQELYDKSKKLKESYFIKLMNLKEK